MKEKNENKNVPISPELVAKAKAGDQAAFSELYQLTNTALYRSIRAMVHNEDTAWDIEQETYLKAYQSLDKLDHNEAFLPWLRRISVNVTATEMSKRLPMNFSDLADEDGDLPEQVDLSIDAQPELAMDRKETSRLVREILSELPEQQHLVLGMHYYEDLSVKEICELLHLAPSTVKTQLIRGRKHVETRVRALEKQGVKLYGLSPMAFLVALMRRAEPAERAAWSTGRAVMAQAFGDAAATAVPVAAKTFGQVLTGRLLAGALAVALIGGGIWGGARLLKSKQRDNPYQPTTVETNERLSGVETPEEISETNEDLPVITEPAVTEPVVTEPAETQPAATEPAVTEPSGTEPADPTEPSDATEPTEPEIDPSWPSGTCGDNLSWYLKPDGLLVIQGSGAMTGYFYLDHSPWIDYCEFITGVSLPVGLTNIADYAFYRCSALTSVTIPEGVTSIGERAFEECNALTSVTIPDSVTSVGDQAFWGCNALTSVTFGSGLTDIGLHLFYDPFEDSDSLSAIYVSPDNPSFSSQDGVLFNKSKTELLFYPGGKTDPFYAIPDSVTKIRDSAFSCNSFLTSVTIPDSVTIIGAEAFWRCTALESVTIGSGVTDIERTTLGYTCLSCDSLSAIYVSPDNPSFSSQDGVLFNKSKTELIQYPQGKAEAFYAIPDGVTQIGEEAFKNCQQLTGVTIPGSVTSIGRSAFQDCGALTGVTIPGSVTSIGDSAFCDCLALSSVTISDGVTSIGRSAFSGCERLQSVTIPGSVTSIPGYAFYECRGLTNVTIGDGVTVIDDAAFYECYSLTGVTIPGSVKLIGDAAFAFCNSLERVTICEGVELISARAFFDCHALGEVTIPASVTGIDELAFSFCSEDLTIYGYADTAAERYANENQIRFVAQ